MSKKYCVLDLVEKLESLKYSSWYLASEWSEHNYDNEYKVAELRVDKGECVLSIKKYDRGVGDYVERQIVVDPCEVFLLPFYATEFEYQEILKQIPGHLREQLKDIVADKCNHAAVAGYNGCI